MARNKLIALALAGLVLSGCQNGVIRNPLAGYQEPSLGPLPKVTQNKAPKTQVAWTQKIGEHVGLSGLQPLVIGKTVFVADTLGKLQALDRSSGQALWTIQTEHTFSAGPAKVDRALVVGTTDAKVMAFDAQTGAQLWQQTLSASMLAPAAGNQNIAVIKTIDGAIQAHDLRDGNLLWRVDYAVPALTLRYHSAPKVVDDKVIVGLPSGKCMALNLQSGYTLWERNISLPRGRSELQRMVDISADPIIDQNTVYVTAYQGKMAALKLDTGTVLWEKELSAFHDIAHDRAALYVTDSDYNIWAVAKDSGLTLWKQDKLAKREVTAPAVIQNKLVVADKKGYLHWLDKREGQVLGYSRTERKVKAQPVVSANQVFIRSGKGKLAALDIEGAS